MRPRAARVSRRRGAALAAAAMTLSWARRSCPHGRDPLEGRRLRRGEGHQETAGARPRASGPARDRAARLHREWVSRTERSSPRRMETPLESRSASDPRAGETHSAMKARGTGSPRRSGTTAGERHASLVSLSAAERPFRGIPAVGQERVPRNRSSAPPRGAPRLRTGPRAAHARVGRAQQEHSRQGIACLSSSRRGVRTESPRRQNRREVDQLWAGRRLRGRERQVSRASSRLDPDASRSERNPEIGTIDQSPLRISL